MKYKLQFRSNTLGFEYYNDVTSLSAASEIELAPDEEKVIDVVLGNLQGNASISGTITDTNGAFIESATVDAEIKDGDSWNLISTDFTINNNTNFTLNNLVAGEYRLRFHSYAHAEEFYDDATDPANATIITLVDSENKTGINAKLGKRPILKGTVTDTDGLAVEAVQVEFYQYYDYGNGDGSWDPWDSVTTDSNGYYIFDGYLIANTKYRLKFSNQTLGFEFYNDVITLATASDVEIALDEERVIDVVLGNLDHGNISGKITNISGTGIENIDIFAMYKEEDEWVLATSVTTDSNGNYHLNHLPINQYILSFQGSYMDGYLSEYHGNTNEMQEATLITLASNENKIINAQLDKSPTVSGTVTDTNGNLLANILVELVTYHGNGTWDSSYSYSIATDNNGYYIFNSGFAYIDTNATYTLRYSSPDYGFEIYDDATNFSSAHPFHLM